MCFGLESRMGFRPKAQGCEERATLGISTAIIATPTGVAPKDQPLCMPQSLSAVYIHLVFSSKDRRPLLRDLALRTSLHAYLGEISKRLDCPSILAGGVEDHVHLLIRLGRTMTQAE